jgi:hypothetical protein
MSQRTIVFIAWGQRYVEAVRSCIDESRLPDYPILVMTDPDSDVSTLPAGVAVVRHDFQFRGKERKLEAFAALPAALETVLFLDTDTRVLADITLGFEKSEEYGIAMSAAPHYSLGDFRTFSEIMQREGVTPLGQMIYNSGVIFFAANRPKVREVFTLALELARKDPLARWSDQPYVTLAMEMLGFNPYTLSPSFNHRGFGELISGSVRIWHSNDPVPPGAADLEPGFLHRYEGGVLVRAMRVPLS